MNPNQHNNNDQGNNFAIRRAIIIGLGGTGGEVLARSRKLLIDRYGRLEDLPIVKFLSIDTDSAWIERIFKQMPGVPPLDKSEFVNAEISNTSDLFAGIEAKNYPHYDWFSIDSLINTKDILNGAGTIRQLGRLCFWHHYDKIKKSISDHINSVVQTEHDSFMQKTHGQQVDQGLSVYIVGSLAGGTGSSCFLDTAYLVRHLLAAANVTNHELMGMLVMPQAFNDINDPRTQANGYAALKELNYFSYRSNAQGANFDLFGAHPWNVQYTNDPSDHVTFESQFPFDFCYLIDSKNEHVNANRDDVFAMISRAVYEDFASELYAFRRAIRANVRTAINQNDPLDCPAYFMSFGQSTIRLPVREIKHILERQLALRAAQSWLDRSAEPVNILAVESSGASSSAPNIVEEAETPNVLGAVRQHIITDFIPQKGLLPSNMLASIQQYKRTRLVDQPYTVKEETKRQWITEKWPRSSFIDKTDHVWSQIQRDYGDRGAEPAAWGSQIRLLAANMETARKLYLNNIETHANQLLEDPQRGPAWSIAFINLLQSYLSKTKEDFIAAANSSTAIANDLGDIHIIKLASGPSGASLSAMIEKRITEEQAKLADTVRAKFGVRPSLDKRTQDQADEYLKWCAHWARAKIEERSRRLAAEDCGMLDAEIDSLRKDMLETVAALAHLNFELVDQTRRWIREARDTVKANDILFDEDIVAHIERVVSRNRGAAYNPELIAKLALEEADVKIKNVTESHVKSILDALLSKASDAVGDLSESNLLQTELAIYDMLAALSSGNNEVLKSRLEQTASYSAPYISLKQPLMGHWAPQGGFPNGPQRNKRVALKGGTDTGDLQRSNVLQALNAMGWRNQDIASTTSGEQIVFIQEIGGFPLRALNGMDNLKRIYDSHARTQANPLHIVNDEQAKIYPEIEPPKRPNNEETESGGESDASR